MVSGRNTAGRNTAAYKYKKRSTDDSHKKTLWNLTFFIFAVVMSAQFILFIAILRLLSPRRLFKVNYHVRSWRNSRQPLTVTPGKCDDVRSKKNNDFWILVC